MPYIYVEELEEGQEDADVRGADEYNALQIELDTVVGARDELQRSYDELVGERDNLAAELDNAKTKFADAFLSSPERMKAHTDDEKAHAKASTFSTLFDRRDDDNAN